MLADKDIERALGLLDEWEAGDTSAKGKLAALGDVYAKKAPTLAMMTYPSLTNPRFHELLQRMRGMYAPKLSPATMEKLHGRAKPLLPHQHFVNTYMSPGTGYNGLLLVHDVGVGKTCTAVSVAEMYHGTMAQPAIVLTSAALQRQWKEEIAGVSKARYVSGAWQLPPSCAGSAYDRVGRRVTVESRKALEHAVHAAIRTRYEFYAYIEFNNRFEAIQANVTATREQLVRKAFSDRVIIVDEAHHLRSSQDAMDANDALMYIVKNTSNVKVVLLTATPMFDRATEIVNLLNILRCNDGRSKLRIDDLFEKESGMVHEAKLAEACRGYISYMPGGDPKTFPSQVTPSMATGKAAPKWPKFAIDGTECEPPAMMLELTVSRASDLQEAAMLSSGATGVPELSDVEPDEATSRQISTIAYPGDGRNVNDQFKQCISGSMGKGDMRYRAGYEGMFGDRLGEFSPKIQTVMNYVAGCKGIAMIYTFWISGGILPVALALEEAGFARVHGPPLIKSKNKKNGKRYAIITSDPDLTPEASKLAILAALKDPKNVDGASIAVVLVSQTVSEGVDLKNVREVHMMEPWWNMGRPDQIVGRAARYMSHAALPEPRRNVTVYHHVCVLSGNREGLDHVYVRRALEKREGIASVLRVLRAGAVDCAFNKDKMNRPAGRSTTLQTSQGRTIRWTAGDRDFSKACLYAKCVPSNTICTHDHLLAPGARNGSLLDVSASDGRVVSALLEYEYDVGLDNMTLTLHEIRERLGDLPHDVIDDAVSTLVDARTRFSVKGKVSTLTRIGDLYTMVPTTSRHAPLTTSIPPTGVIVDLVQDDDEVVSACEVDDEVQAFLEHTDESARVVAAAVDAVVDRKQYTDLIQLARCGRATVLASMKEGGLLVGTVVSLGPKGLDISTSATVAPVRMSLDEATTSRLVSRMDGRTFVFSSSHRGKSCMNMSRGQLAKALQDKSFVVGDVSSIPKVSLCHLVELSHRLEGLILRPGQTPHKHVA